MPILDPDLLNLCRTKVVFFFPPYSKDVIQAIYQNQAWCAVLEAYGSILT